MSSDRFLRNTATFIDSPGACSSPSTILTVNEIVAVEEDPDLSVHFTVIPDEERLLLVDQNEDRQVTSLVQKLLCGETFKPEDFPGGDQSFSPSLSPLKLKIFLLLETAEKRIVNAQRGRFEGMENNIEELRTLICKSLGLPEGSKSNARKRKAMDDPRSSSVSMIEVSRKNPPSSERESGHQNDDDHAKENESDNARFPPSGGNKGDQQQETQSNALVLFGDVLDVEPESYVLPAEHAVTSGERNPTHRYEQGSPVAWEKTKRALLTDLMQERSAPEGGEGHQKWVGAPPVGYESDQTSNQNEGEGLEQVSAPMGFVEALVKEINSEIPGADEGAQPKENESVAARMTPTAGIDFAQKTGADNGGESGQTPNQSDGERLEQVSAPMGFVEALVKEINSERTRATRGGEGAQPKENKSVAARMTPTAGIGFAQKTGGDNGGEFVEEDPDLLTYI
ncbi:hypothetical protein Bca52824_047389 [Brassica carinata]|uniref:Uncharacterized protein n=1 Tax=Brassica carinata TaxID=52824 RepID=A0A8X7RJ19_BRACI|nr:hypothetical protein Bca52824_047389 [Brassica carinata]